MTLTYESDLDRVKMNYDAKYLGQRPLRLTVSAQIHRHSHTHTHTQTQPTDCST